MSTERDETGEAAIMIIEGVVNRWIDLGRPMEKLAEVLLATAVDIHVRAMGEVDASDYLHRIADELIDD